MKNSGPGSEEKMHQKTARAAACIGYPMGI